MILSMFSAHAGSRSILITSMSLGDHTTNHSASLMLGRPDPVYGGSSQGFLEDTEAHQESYLKI